MCTRVKGIKHLGEALTIQFKKQIINISFYFSQDCSQQHLLYEGI